MDVAETMIEMTKPSVLSSNNDQSVIASIKDKDMEINIDVDMKNGM